jgi:Putative Flp pilus-assembly TadE/G-like
MKRHSRERGQVLPVFAIFLVVLMGLAALAIDVSGALSARRFYRSVADSSSLAGAQDLQVGTSRTVTGAERTRARTDAMSRLVSLLGASSTPGSCDPAADIIDCAMPGTGYLVSIKTPASTCVACDPYRSVQVVVRNPAYGLTFARILGQSTWNVGSTSVAGLTFGKSYTIITLRPPKKLGSTFDVRDITIDGGTVVTVSRGDVGSNANMNYSGTGSRLILNPDYSMYYFPGPAPFDVPQWGSPPDPSAQPLTNLIQDPNYQYPSMVGAPPDYTEARTSHAGDPGVPVKAGTDPTCAAEIAKVDIARYAFMATQPPASVFCFDPGVYDGSKATIDIGTGEVGLLKPGAYYLRSGMNISGRLIGGYEPAKPGVALMFDECSTSACIFKGNNAPDLALNAGTRYPPAYGGGTPATAAIDWAGNFVQTSGPDSPNPPLPLTILVKKDPTCFVPTAAPWQEPSGCDALKDKTINIAGGGHLALEGVQYAPTDNVEISGGAGTDGRVGQIISWTLKYSGGVAINQEGPASEGVGILRLDAACTSPATNSIACNP